MPFKDNVSEVASQLCGDALGVLLETEYKSYTAGSDRLVELGIWDNDGSLTDFGYNVCIRLIPKPRIVGSTLIP